MEKCFSIIEFDYKFVCSLDNNIKFYKASLRVNPIKLKNVNNKGPDIDFELNARHWTAVITVFDNKENWLFSNPGNPETFRHDKQLVLVQRR